MHYRETWSTRSWRGFVISAAVLAVAVTARGEGRDSSLEHEIRFTLESIEWGELSSDVVDLASGAELGEIDIEDIERDTYKLRYRFGDRASGFHADVFLEEVEVGLAEYDLVGFGLGVDGAPELARFAEDEVSIFMEYAVDASYHDGDGDIPVVNGAGQIVGTLDTDLRYFEIVPRLGAGVGFAGIALSGGVQVSVLRGEFEFDDLSVDGDIEGENVGAYAALAYRGDEVPISLRLEGLFGDIEGFAVSVGLRF